MTLETLLQAGRDAGLFTDAAVHVVGPGFEHTASVGSARLFDVASITKVFTAALAVRHLPLQRRIEWLDSQPRVAELLAHHSGLPAWAPFFTTAARALDRTPAALVKDASLHEDAKAIARRAIAATPPSAPKPTYSDLNFLSLGWELETIAPLPKLLETFGLPETRWGGEAEEAAPTGNLRPRPWSPEGAPPETEPSGDHAVDDDNAAVMGGLCGHAGVWSTARDVARLGATLLEGADGDWKPLFEPAGGGRTFGLDTPTGETSSIGSLLGKGPLGAAGHLGFTGCSLWMDRDARLSIALLTNAVLFERPAVRLRAWRREVHDTIARLAA